MAWPADGVPMDASERVTDFRLMRRGGFYHAVARYGSPIWVTFTYVGLHATERILRRKQEHRFWGLDTYTHEHDRYFRIANRVFYEDPGQTVEPSAPLSECSAGNPETRTWLRSTVRRRTGPSWR